VLSYSRDFVGRPGLTTSLTPTPRLVLRFSLVERLNIPGSFDCTVQVSLPRRELPHPDEILLT
jgi:hypothetical protein